VVSDQVWQKLRASPDARRMLLQQLGALLQDLQPQLSAAESEVLVLLASGIVATKEIARLRGVSERAVQIARAAIARKARAWSSC
jgi:DNA-binding CsgD family transcriptional regulator